MATIVLVEDEQDARTMLELGLRRHGHTVCGFANGVEALAALDGSFDLVISDLVMPHLDGIGLLKALIAREHAALRIVITSFADKQRTVEALNLGAHYLLEKPFTVERLVNIIEHVQKRGAQLGSVDQIFQRQLASLPVTERERALIVLVLKGMSNPRIAVLTHSSEQAIKSALFQLYKKLGISSRGELFHLIFPI